MKNFKLLDIVFGWVAFAIAAVTYLLTIEPTASLWDCGEFISSAYKLEVGHPPGAPLFALMGRIFSLFAPSVDKVAMMLNAMSALASAFTILFLFWSITHLMKKYFRKKNNKLTLSESVVTLGCGMIGALAYTFSDSFWFSAGEAEVYATSSLFTAVIFWAALKWEDVADTKYYRFAFYICPCFICIYESLFGAVPHTREYGCKTSIVNRIQRFFQFLVFFGYGVFYINFVYLRSYFGRIVIRTCQ